MRLNTGVNEPPENSSAGPLEPPRDEKRDPNVEEDGTRTPSLNFSLLQDETAGSGSGAGVNVLVCWAECRRRGKGGVVVGG